MSQNTILISTTTFGVYDDTPLKLLKKSGVRFILNPYKRKLTKEETIKLLKGKEGLIAGTEILDKEIMDKSPQLKVISRAGVGLDNVDLEYAKDRGIVVFNTPDVLTDSVAELTVGLMLDCLRGITYLDRETRSGRWLKYTGSLLKNKTVGIVGLGKIGSRVACILKNSFACQVIFYDPYVKSKKFKKVSLDRLLQISDIISLHSSGKELILNSQKIRKLKKGVIIINTSRASLIDEEVIVRALKDNTVFFAAFDVFKEEPYNGKLREIANVVLTPHVGSYAKEARIEMEKQAVDNLIKGFKKRCGNMST